MHPWSAWFNFTATAIGENRTPEVSSDFGENLDVCKLEIQRKVALGFKQLRGECFEHASLLA
jgi:hypothetical protein